MNLNLSASEIILIILSIIAVIAAFNSFFIVQTQQAAVVQRLGRFVRVAQAGLNLKMPFFDQVVARRSLRVQQFDLAVRTKTKDNVFVTVELSVQLQVPPEKVADAYYKLTNVEEQIDSYTENIVLAHVPSMDFDDVFNNSQAIIGAHVKSELETVVTAFGYQIVNALITNVLPPDNVREAMDRINASRRNQVANEAQGEADKILVVKRAEAEAKSKALQGEGIANQRKAIIEGLQQSVEAFKTATGVKADDVMALVLLTQYLDTMKEIGANNKSTTILLPHSPSAVKDLFSQIRDGIIAAEQVPTIPAT